MPSWGELQYELPDARLVQAQREILRWYGKKVDIDTKAKSLLRFGKNSDLTLNQETVWTLGGHETYLTDNTITHVSSTSTVDTHVVRLEGHTVSGTGSSQVFTFVVQDVTLQGQTPVALATPVARTSHAYNYNGTDLVGDIYFYENSSVTLGEPDDLTKAHLHIPAGSNQAFKAATTFDNETFAIVTQGFGGVGNKQTANVEFELQVRGPGGVFLTGSAITAGSSSGNFNVDLDPCPIIPINSDVRVVCTSDNAGAEAFVNINMYMAKVIS